MLKNVRQWHEHVLAIGQLRHQLATAPNRVTHAADAVAAHQCHELWFRTHVAECLRRAFIPAFRYVIRY